MPDFIFMLTRRDRTVEDCLVTLDAAHEAGVTHIGFKDVGVDRATLHELARRIRAAGATSYLEMVSTSVDGCLAAARTARAAGVDRLLGGTAVAATLDVLHGSDIAYLPFPGRPSGHPTRLAGTPAEVAAHCRAFRAQGCAGADLLAWRATDAEPLELVRAARESLGDGCLVVAGSVDSPERVHALAAAGADAFTIGSAVFDGSFSPRKGAIVSRLRDVLAACRDTAQPAGSRPPL